MKTRHGLLILILLALPLAVTASTGLPATCEDPCTILGATPGYVPAAVSIASGTSAVWQSLDVTHPAGEAFPEALPCFIASTTAGEPSPPVVFTWDGATMRADGTVCGSATTLRTGEGFLVYRCLLHASMVGTLVVT